MIEVQNFEGETYNRWCILGRGLTATQAWVIQPGIDGMSIPTIQLCWCGHNTSTSRFLFISKSPRPKDLDTSTRYCIIKLYSTFPDICCRSKENWRKYPIAQPRYGAVRRSGGKLIRMEASQGKTF